ncbi:MAG: TonB-dependent receptor [Tannerellaceae bacterium]|jgi:TonB-linked SusC/RagA family outer membrane protein|nr:TonB-dependent receptor [Tannerellaceae bacterium]
MKKSFILCKATVLLLFFFLSLAVTAQNVTVTGTVTDRNGETLIGVNIVEKGTANGTITDLNGRFTLSVTRDAVLDFSYVGYVTQSVAVQGRNRLDILLADDSEILEEVVVIGYGTQRREAITGSVASVSEGRIKEVPATNITQALQGRVAGMEMAQTSSRPGAEMQIRIRGTRSLNASNDPLVVLDGIPFAGNIGDIDPNTIKSIDILKDASATAIYGSRGANGVILVTTFRGAEAIKPQVSYNGYYGAKDVFAPFPMMTGPEFTAMRLAAGMYKNSDDESDATDTNWQDLLYQPGAISSHDVSFSGGAGKGGYNFGVGYYGDKGVIPTQDYTRYSIRGTFDQEIRDRFRFGITTNTSYNVTNGSNVGMYGVLSMSPLAGPYDASGNLRRIIRMPLDNQWMYTREVLDEVSDRWLNTNKAFGSYNTFFGEVKIPYVDGLKYRINLGLNFRTTAGGEYTGEGINSSTEDTPSTAAITHSLRTNWAVENLVTYDRTFDEKHQINVVAMYSAEQTHYNSSRVSARDIPADHFQFYNLGQAAGEFTVDPARQSYELSGLLSYMGRVMYSYDGRYMLSATVRSDASSRLAPGHRWHTYPAVSAGWNISEEGFLRDVSWLDRLKIRAGYGQTSNQAVDPYQTLGLLSTRPYNFGDIYDTGYYVSQLPNSELGWEYSQTRNYGIDFSLFNNRLSGTFEYYIQNTNNVLLSVNLPATSGVSSYMANIGETQNKGFEFSLNGVILDNLNGWTWEAGLNLYSNRNKLVSLVSGQERDEGNQWFVGYPIDAIYDYEKIGLWQEGDPYLDILEPGGNVGMIKVKYTGDYNADGTPVRQIGADDRQIINTEPDFQGGFNTRLAYGDFDLGIVGLFKSGGVLVSTLYAANGYLNMLTGRRGNVKVDYWTPENTDAKYPKPGGMQSGDNPKYGSTLGYFDASYLKVRTITLGYNVKASWLRSIYSDRLRLYLTVQNPFVFFSPYHSESGMDPETNSYGDENVAVSGLRRILTIGTNSPATRNYLLGINLTF